MIITKLEYQKKNPDRVNVFIDGRFAVGINSNDILTLQLFKDKEISQQELNNLLAQSEFGKLLNFALNFLSFRPRSEWEVRMRLKRKDSGQARMTDQVIDKLKQIGQIDDLKFGQWFVDQRNTFRPKGRRMLEIELRRKGLAPEIIKAVLKENPNEFGQALLIVQKKFKDKFDREKIIRFLGNRGFSWDIIESVIARLFQKE